MDQAEQLEQFDELVKASYFAAAIFYIHGNIARAEGLARKAEEQALALGNSGWADRALFLRGRFCFETGRYGPALEIFKSLVRDEGEGLRGASARHREETLAAWIYRTEAYLGKGKNAGPRTGPEPGASGDGLLFRLEAACLGGRYEEAARLGEGLLGFLRASGGNIPEEDFFFTEQPDWRSGFEQCEFIIIPRKLFRTRLALVYYSLARSRLSVSGGEREAVIGDMRPFLREELQGGLDPQDPFYYYAYYRLLQEASQPQGDMNTAISIAFKQLQRRAGRIDDMEIRQSYLNNHYWNSALGRAAREYKLI
jgi:tetratricopeptide (TPR) repeat protein